MSKLTWDKITDREFDAEISDNFFVECLRGDVMKEENTGGDYDDTKWYGYFWSYNKAKGRLCRRRICERDTFDECIDVIDEYVLSNKIQEEISLREKDMEADNAAKLNIERMGNALGIPKPKKFKKKIPVTDYSTKRVIDLD
jgi:hypothetical protein